MARTLTRPAAPPRRTGVEGKTQQYLSLGEEIKALEARRNALKKDLGAVVDDNGDADDKGSLFLELDTPIVVGNKTYTHLKRERRSSPQFLEEKAEEWLHTNGLWDEATETITVIDQDKLYVLNQQERIPDDVLDSFFEDKITWAFVPVTG